MNDLVADADVAAETKKSDSKPREKRKRDSKVGFKVSQEPMNIARDRHMTGLMHEWVCQILQRVRLLLFDQSYHINQV